MVFFISQDKYVAEILKKFDFASVKTASTPIETQKPLTMDEEVADVDAHLYKYVIGSLMYLTASRPDIMFAVCACSRFQGLLYSFLRDTYGAELVSAASLINTVRPKLLLLGLVGAAQKCLTMEKLVLPGNVGAAWHKVSAARKKFVLLVTVTTVVNDEKQIHATVDSKVVVVVIEASIRSYLLLNDVALFSPQGKYLIHTILHCLSSKSISWNEFSTNIASAVICLATNQKFNFSKLIFDGMLRNLDNPKKKFLMYPRFLMVFLNNQIELGEPFNDVYITPAHTLKVFSNMSRKGVKFSGKVTPLFDSRLVPHQAHKGEGSEQPTEPQPTPSPTQPSTVDQLPVTDSSFSHDTTQDSRDSLEGTNRSEGDQVQPSYDSNLSGGPTSDRAKGGMTLEELYVLCINLLNRVLALEASKDAQAEQIIKLKTRIKKLKKKRRKESVSKQGRKNAKPEPTLDDSIFDDLDADHGMDYMNTEKPVNEGRLIRAKMDASEELAARLQMEEREMYTVEERSRLLVEYFENRKKQLATERSAAIRNKPPIRTQLRSLMMTYLKHTCRYKHDQLNKKILEEIQALYIKEQERATDFVPIGSEKDERMIEKIKKKASGVDEEEVLEEPNSTKVEVKQEGNTESTRKRPGKRLKIKATKKSKRQKTDFDLKEEEQLKSFLMIVPDEEGEIDYEVLDNRNTNSKTRTQLRSLDDGPSLSIQHTWSLRMIKKYDLRTMNKKEAGVDEEEHAKLIMKVLDRGIQLYDLSIPLFYHTIDMENLILLREFNELEEVRDITRLLLNGFKGTDTD
ncbi:hypothetical protein Tco_0575670 [Tanacetum coccineum]